MTLQRALMQSPTPNHKGRPAPATPATWALRILGAIVLLVLAVLIWNAWDHQAFIAWREEAGVLPFFFAMAILPALGVPITPFFIVAGATFGVHIGLAGSAIALSANLLLCYWIARSGLRPWLSRLLARTRYSIPDFEKGEGALRFTLLVKLAPGVPIFIKHYLLGMAGVPFWIYFAVSGLITGVYAVAFVVLGESLLEHDLGNSAAALAVLGLVALAIYLWRRRITNRQDAE
ncbi:VTT domain-containing protein [Pseudomonas sp. MM211]|uniref:TVP38/TMEM64 family protein n=1 Tax=Pseudomonas sp. MM211 TaxID=2866808 RepID=UPI001CEC1F47|nr:VTT domain-containing protein [Pseudomonas sp. MM211]UCJ17822.1 VTT domain-containing protein [Pseudomonas sp. MM211]